MAQKVSIDFDVEEIKALVQQTVASSPGASRAVPGIIGRYARAVEQQQQFDQLPVGGSLMAAGLALQRQRAESSLQRNLQQAQETPFSHALRAIHLGGSLFAGGGGVGGFGHVAGSFGQISALVSAMNPATAAFTAAALAVTGLSVAAVEAGKMLRTLAQGALATGSTPGGFAFARALGGAAGLSPEGTGGMLQALRQRIATEPLAMAAAGQFGVRALPPGFGPVPNMGAMFQTLFGAMRGMSTAGKQQFAERIPEMQPFLAVAQFGSDAQIERIKRLAESMDELATPEAVRRSIDLSLAQQELSMEWNKLVTEIGTAVLPAVTVLVEALEGFGKVAIHLAKAAFDFQTGNPLGAFKEVKELFNPDAAKKGGDKDRDKHGKDLRDHSDAMREHAGELRLTRNGVFGGGARAQGAIPAGLRGDALQRALDANAVRLGAF